MVAEGSAADARAAVVASSSALVAAIEAVDRPAAAAEKAPTPRPLFPPVGMQGPQPAPAGAGAALLRGAQAPAPLAQYRAARLQRVAESMDAAASATKATFRALAYLEAGSTVEV